jgi:hypothetical protein
LRAGLEKCHAGTVVDRFREHRPHEAQVVRNFSRIREQFAHPRAAFAMLRKFERRADERNGRLVARHSREPLAGTDRVGKLLAVAFVEQRLVVEQIELRRTAGHEQIDHALRLRCKMWFAEHAEIGRGRCDR